MFGRLGAVIGRGGNQQEGEEWHRAQGELGSADEGLDEMCSSTPKIKIKGEHGGDGTMTTKIDFLRASTWTRTGE